ncbi:MAG TPA: S-methyl-5-thioribose-1-phosphate isomerase [Candidatus Bathyarchaeia archaeon]|nr:S-methyl-5-thioribose-1-phosphate isomerase [Candidatus Bathyarchaeia archaeon]
MSSLRTVEWYRGRVRMIDQTKLPERFVYVTYDNYRQVAKAIREMVVRGAPAIGVAAGMGLALAAGSSKAKNRDRLMVELQAAATVLRKSRPTAWNLFWGVDRVLRKAEAANGTVSEIISEIVREAELMADEDVEANRRIGEYGANLIDDGDRIMTHCNAGTLATVSYGTALAPIRTAIHRGKKVSVIATETRPRLQGAKLTVYELLSDKIPVTLIVDGAAGYTLMSHLVNKVIVGADRITTSVVANKVGTYPIALAAKANGVPFYVAAPTSTFNLHNDPSEVKIEERDADEVVNVAGKRITPKGVKVFNPAFDLTPVELVTGFITEKGVIDPSQMRMRLE